MKSALAGSLVRFCLPRTTDYLARSLLCPASTRAFTLGRRDQKRPNQKPKFPKKNQSPPANSSDLDRTPSHQSEAKAPAEETTFFRKYYPPENEKDNPISFNKMTGAKQKPSWAIDLTPTPVNLDAVSVANHRKLTQEDVKKMFKEEEKKEEKEKRPSKAERRRIKLYEREREKLTKEMHLRDDSPPELWARMEEKLARWQETRDAQAARREAAKKAREFMTTRGPRRKHLTYSERDTNRLADEALKAQAPFRSNEFFRDPSELR
ncbi:hypothetical protein F4780DRAFT_761180 [Xylariomycetidae sp. FL0641]|nr:hypothetical protein F4780DRAFT_761180 [Xylariomycetidae sp. FL0641]